MSSVAGTGKRDAALDATRGIAILAVVIFHMTRGFTESGELARGMALTIADDMAYSFHVQTFFFIAGYLAFPKAGSMAFQVKRQATLYYIYLLWSLISWTLSSVMARSVNHPVSITDLLLIPVVPIQHFWFLLPLMGGTALLGVLRTPLRIVAGCLAVMILSNIPGVQLGIWGSTIYVLGGGLLRALDVHPRTNLLIGLGGVLILFAGAWSGEHGGPWLHVPYFYPIVVSGCYAAYVFGSHAARTPMIGPALMLLGRRSMSIYLLHVITGSGLRVVLSHVAPGMSVWLALLLAILSGICGPMAIEWIAEQTGTAGLLGFRPLPFWQRKAPANAAS